MGHLSVWRTPKARGAFSMGGRPFLGTYPVPLHFGHFTRRFMFCFLIYLLFRKQQPFDDEHHEVMLKQYL
jgi:hypothetical protein